MFRRVRQLCDSLPQGSRVGLEVGISTAFGCSLQGLVAGRLGHETRRHAGGGGRGVRGAVRCRRVCEPCTATAAMAATAAAMAATAAAIALAATAAAATAATQAPTPTEDAQSAPSSIFVSPSAALAAGGDFFVAAARLCEAQPGSGCAQTRRNFYPGLSLYEPRLRTKRVIGIADFEHIFDHARLSFSARTLRW